MISSKTNISYYTWVIHVDLRRFDRSKQYGENATQDLGHIENSNMIFLDLQDVPRGWVVYLGLVLNRSKDKKNFGNKLVIQKIPNLTMFTFGCMDVGCCSIF